MTERRSKAGKRERKVKMHKNRVKGRTPERTKEKSYWKGGRGRGRVGGKTLEER